MSAPFLLPTFAAPLDLESRLPRVPPDATVKGMFFQSVADEAKAASGVTVGRGRWVAFKDYPTREWLTLLVECARLVHPRVSPRESLRRLGQNAYPTFLSSTVGRVLMSVADNDLALALRQVPRIYAVSGNTGRAELGELTEGRAIIQLRNVWDFTDSWQVGVFEGGMRAFRKQGSVLVRALSICDADLELTW